jgi:hypothetical protein
MLSLLFLLGLVFGVGMAVIAVAGVVIAVVTSLAWLNEFVAIMAARAKQPQPPSGVQP